MRTSIKFMFFIFSIIVVTLILFERISDKGDQTETTMQPAITEIMAGFDGNSKIINQGFDIMNHPSGVYAYTKSWDDSNGRGVVRFLHGKNSFEIDNVTILTGLGDADFPENGIDNWSLSFRLGPEKTDSYEIARDKTMSLLRRLRETGWKRYIEGSDPRLSGKKTVAYALSGSGQTYSLDSTYTPTLDEWKRLTVLEPTWEFYANGVFINFTISHWASDVPDAGRYLANIKISTAADNYFPYFSDDDDDKKRHWKKYLSDRLAPVRHERSIVEAKLDPHEFAIDTSYEPPPFEAPDFSANAKAAGSH